MLSPTKGRLFLEKSTSHMQVLLLDCRTDSVIRGEIEESNRSSLHCGNYARCVPSQRRMVRAKTLKMSHGERNILWWRAGNCRSSDKIDESNVVFSGGYMVQSFAYRYDSEE
jgi:hypothetical protein